MICSRSRKNNDPKRAKFTLLGRLLKLDLPSRSSLLELRLSVGKETSILKNVPQSEFKSSLVMYSCLRNDPCLGLLHCTVPERSMLVYEHFVGDFFSLVQKILPVACTKCIRRVE